MTIFNTKFLKPEIEFLSWIEEDYVPLYDVVRLFSDYSKVIPREEEYLATLDFLNYLLNKHRSSIKYYVGPGVRLIRKSPVELIKWLKEMWYAGKYRKIDRSIWFELAQKSSNAIPEPTKRGKKSPI